MRVSLSRSKNMKNLIKKEKGYSIELVFSYDKIKPQNKPAFNKSKELIFKIALKCALE